jgi:hypothetical protein
VVGLAGALGGQQLRYDGDRHDIPVSYRQWCRRTPPRHVKGSIRLKPPRTTDANLVLNESGCAVASVTKRYARTVSGMAFALMAVDFIDRQLVVAAFTYLKAEWRLSDTQLGALVSIVSVTVALGAFPTALLADRWSRVKAIAVMGTTRSLATLAGGFPDFA